MTVLTFPTSPTLGQQYAAPNGIQYVFDGVKWIVETVASTSAAVTNSVQDRVAPMFVEGTHQGITFAYNAGTNSFSANVTSVNGDTLVNGLNEVVLGADGTTTFPTGGQIANYPGGVGASNNSWFVTPGNDGNGGVSSQDGQQYIQINNNLFVEIGTSYGTPNESLWRFGRDGALNSPGGSFTKTTNNFLATNVATQVVWTSTQTDISGVKLTIQVECDETGTANWHTQICEAIIAVRGYNSSSEPVMSVYGITHTSVAPLMTFSVQRNPTTFLIEIVGTRTATARLNDGADLRIYSVETGTND